MSSVSGYLYCIGGVQYGKGDMMLLGACRDACEGIM